jgi:soluble lytic murein transglycosylase-like protein
MTESGGDPTKTSPKGAKGLFQFMDPTAKQYGINPYDAGQSTTAAAQYDSMLLRRYGGDVRKALAAYNWGMGNLDKNIAKNGANWETNLPQETQNYIAKILARMAQNKPAVTVTVNNNTSARVAVQANAAAAQ